MLSAQNDIKDVVSLKMYTKHSEYNVVNTESMPKQKCLAKLKTITFINILLFVKIIILSSFPLSFSSSFWPPHTND